MPVKKRATPPTLQPRLRVYLGHEIALGPGKAELLGHLAETRSLSDAARRMKMSYMKAWLLVQTMNRSFRQPLVTAERGGSRGGGATLTAEGKRVLALYNRMEAASQKAMAAPWKRLKALLREK